MPPRCKLPLKLAYSAKAPRSVRAVQEFDVTEETASLSAPTNDKKWKITEIGPLLQWVAVAYGAGFLTVMMHTHTLHIPVVELVEPIYIWVGLPLAVALYSVPIVMPPILGQMGKNLLLELREVKEMREGLSGYWTSMERGEVPNPKEFPRDHPKIFWCTKKFYSALTYFGVLDAFISYALKLQFFAWALLLLVIYIHVVYPRIPQSLGGGRPSPVRLIVDGTKIPVDDVDLGNLFPQGVTEKSTAEKSNRESSGPASRTTCGIVLHYENEHAYYVQRGRGPIVAIDHGAVNGVIFGPLTGPQQKGCT